jgi:S1-C subfamily serine protease
MQRWTANLLGLAIGCALAALLLLWLGPHRGATRVTTQPERASGPHAQPGLAAAAFPASRRLATLPDPPAAVSSDPTLPQRVYPGSKPASQDADPHVVPVAMPDVPGPAPAPGTIVAGTGFFVAADGSLLTASHVVRACAHIRIVSQSVGMADAEKLAEDRSIDVALLRARQVHPPAVLALATSRPAGPRLFILGFPATASLRVPDETWGSVENARLPVALALGADLRQTVWVQSSAVTHGYSGGPMLDPGTGSVAGLVKAGVEPKFVPLARGGLPLAGLLFGPGAAQLAAFLRRTAPQLDLATDRPSDQEALDAARRATVHVLCWR